MKIKVKDRNAILQSLRNGVVPRTGLQHILVGRERELDQINKDLSTITQGGATMRFVIGDYGAGKTFFLNLAKLFALQKGLVVMNADVTNDRRVQGSGGQAVSLYSELTRNIATRTRSDGGALKSVIERFIAEAVAEGEATEQSTRKVIRERLEELSELVAGFDFADVLNAYYEGYEAHDDDRQQAALRWLRGEFNGKLEARKALGVRTMVEDDSVYDYLKLFAHFCRLAGYKGLLICLDELASIHSLSNSQSRLQNYEQLLRILNDVNQGSAEYLGLLFGGTTELFEDDRRGISSHEALRTRLAPNQFARDGLVDMAHPVMRLDQLTRDDLGELLAKIRNVHSQGHDGREWIDDGGLAAFIDRQFSKIGAATFLTPRETVKEFVELLSVLEQNPEQTWESILEPADQHTQEPDDTSSSEERELAELEDFKV